MKHDHLTDWQRERVEVPLSSHKPVMRISDQWPAFVVCSIFWTALFAWIFS